MSSELLHNDRLALNEMLIDLDTYDGVLGPGPYWKKNQVSTINWLQKNDLNKFLCYDPLGKALSNFGGGSHWRSKSSIQRDIKENTENITYKISQKLSFRIIENLFRRKIRSLSRELNNQNDLIIALGRLIMLSDSDHELDKIEAYFAEHASDAIIIRDKKYTPKFIYKFFLYLEIKTLAGFETLSSLVEIAPGAGRFAEIVAKLNPSAKCYLVDIPPQLYVTQQFLMGAFPGEVATYHMLKENPSVLEDKSYRIFILAPWQMDLLKLKYPDLLVNQGFEEMSKKTVKAYLEYASKWRTRNIHVHTIYHKNGYDITSIEDYRHFLPRHHLISEINSSNKPNAFAYDPARLSPAISESSALLFQLKDIV